MNIYEQQLKKGRLHAHLPLYKKRLAFAIAGIKAMLSLAPNAYASISFGKQSLCLAYMLYQLTPTTPMFFLASSESWAIHNFLEIIDHFMTHTPIDLTIVQTNRAGLDISEPILQLSEKQPTIKWRFPGWSSPDADWQKSRDRGERDLQEMCARDEWNGWYWGLVKEESRGRKITLSTKWEGQPHPTIFRYTDSKYRCCPLMNWTIDDIAAYVSTYNLKLLSEYERHGLQARTTARTTRMMAEEGGLALLKHRNPSAFNTLCTRFPELRSIS